MKWFKKLFKHKPKFKIGDIVIENRDVEEWEEHTLGKRKILKVGKRSYQYEFYFEPGKKTAASNPYAISLPSGLSIGTSSLYPQGSIYQPTYTYQVPQTPLADPHTAPFADFDARYTLYKDFNSKLNDLIDK